MLENLALRQQLAAFARNGQRPRIVATDRLFRLALRRLWLRWSDVLVFVKPETVVRWHQAGFRRYWTWLSQRRRRGRPPIDARLCALIHRLALENPTWGRRASTASCASFSSVPVPIKKLVGFKKIDLRPGERRTVRFDLSAEQLAIYDEAIHQFAVEPGAFQVMVGSSLEDILASARLIVSP